MKTIEIGGTANIKGIDQTRYTVAMNGTFDGGVFAEATSLREIEPGLNELTLRHYFMNRDGSYVFTEDTSVHRRVDGDRWYAETTYRIVESGGRLAGMRGTFKSWGALDYGTGLGVLRFEGELREEG